MFYYILKKTFKLLLTLFVVVTITFFILDSLPGTPLSYLGHSISHQMEKNYLSRFSLPLYSWEKYLLFIKNIFLHRDLGTSMIYPGRRIAAEIGTYGTTSFILGLKGMLTGLLIGISGALIFSGTKSRHLKGFLSITSLILISTPVFILASLAYYIFAVAFPGSGAVSLGGDNSPIAAGVIAVSISGIYMKYLIEALERESEKDYASMARCKGYSGFKLIYRHLLRNALLPLVSLVLPQLAGLFIGFYVVEGIFSIPGFGNIYVDSINNRDYNMILGATLFFTLFYIVAVYLTDIMYALLDPRIRRRKR